MLSIFVSTILGLVLDPMPVGAWAFLSITFTIASKTLTFGQAFAATQNEVIWLIVVSFFFAKVRGRERAVGHAVGGGGGEQQGSRTAAVVRERGSQREERGAAAGDHPEGRRARPDVKGLGKGGGTSTATVDGDGMPTC